MTDAMRKFLGKLPNGAKVYLPIESNDQNVRCQDFYVEFIEQELENLEVAQSSMQSKMVNINKAFEKECDDIDSICAALGIDNFRTESGYLQKMKILNVIADSKSTVGNLQSLLSAANERIEQLAQSNREKDEFIKLAFIAHPNLDLDIQAIRESE